MRSFKQRIDEKIGSTEQLYKELRLMPLESWNSFISDIHRALPKMIPSDDINRALCKMIQRTYKG